MNSRVLLIVAAVAFVFGYRFYSKPLAVGVLRFKENYSTTPPERPAKGEHGRMNRHLAFGHHVAALAAGAAVTESLAVPARRTNWALALQPAQWWSGRDWILLALAVILIVTELWVTLRVVNALRVPPAPELDTGP